MSHGAILEAEFEDGYVLTEDDADQSPYDEDRNVFHCILHARAEADHGRMVRWTMYLNGQEHTVNWKELWAFDNPRPIYFRKMSREFNPESGWTGPATCHEHNFGYQYNADDGSNVQEVEQIGEF